MESSEIDNSQEIEVADAESAIPPPEVGYCLRCGYDMRGLGVLKCPECGTIFDAEATRKHNVRWGTDILRQLRSALVVAAAGCAAALLYLLTGGVDAPVVAVMGFIGLGLLVVFVLTNVSTKGSRSCGRGFGVALFLLGIPVATASGWFGVVALLVGGVTLNAIQIRSYFEGRRRGNQFGISERLEESLSFAIGVSKFVSVLAVVLLVAVLAVR